MHLNLGGNRYSITFIRSYFMLSGKFSHELDVVNHGAPHPFIELFHQFGSTHLQFRTQCGRSQLHHQNLVMDGQIARALSHHFAGHFGPCRYESVLIERRFKSLLTQIVMNELGDGLCIATFLVLLE